MGARERACARLPAVIRAAPRGAPPRWPRVAAPRARLRPRLHDRRPHARRTLQGRGRAGPRSCASGLLRFEQRAAGRAQGTGSSSQVGACHVQLWRGQKPWRCEQMGWRRFRRTTNSKWIRWEDSLVKQYGEDWVQIQQYIPGRHEEEIKRRTHV